jgi:hypothetical protein
MIPRVASPDREKHLQHLDNFFAALAANGRAINMEKCVFAIPTLEFLGKGLQVCKTLCLIGKLKSHSHAFPCKCWINFSPR